MIGISAFTSIRDKMKRFGYDAITDKGRRRPPGVRVKAESEILGESDRRKLQSTIHDQRRNFAVLAWMIRKHLDYVSSFTFQARNDDPELNKNLERLVTWWSRPRNCDVANRHSLRRLTRLAEAARIVDGDFGLLLLRQGKVQGIESDRIGSKPTQGGIPESYRATSWVQGLDLDSSGATKRYMLLKRVANGLIFDRVVPARNMKLLAHYDRIDQVRGVSPLAAAMNTIADVKEAFEWNLIKAKVHALFGLGISRDSVGGAGRFDYSDADDGGTPDEDTTRYDVNIDGGVFKLELDPGDKVDTIESRTPSGEFMDYSRLMIQVALNALDIPFTFWDSRQSSYSAMRQDLLNYIQSVKSKRGDLIELLDDLIAWKVGSWVNVIGRDGEPILKLPAGMNARDIAWEWVAAGIPWIDPLKEISADAQAVSMAVKSRHQISAERGVDWETTVSQLEAEEYELRKRNISAQLGMPGAVLTTTKDEDTSDET